MYVKETSTVHQMCYKESKPDETNAQVFAVQGFSLVDYSDSGETVWRTKTPAPHYDVLRKITENILVDSGPEVSYRLYFSDETVVKETCDEASPNNHSNEQSDDELVPSLRRTKSFMMDRVQHFAGCLYDSSDDSTEGTFISKPERDSQRLRRSYRHPMSVCQENRGQKMRRACHPCTTVPPHHKSKTWECLQQMSVCQENGSEDEVSMSSVQDCTSTSQVQNQEREVSKLL
ncbi:uncharacterized protein LOC118285762 [Scophthalmus maximus]|uniref:uncharacterized protein LOC118285762 n=1 Tax=Scophthalmus maximus TaxID=52904 RepID=UPI001FA8298E|nr:uncharacterized protein LOC118285762 [Scophthalmus maximus]